MASAKELCIEPAYCKGCGYCVEFCPADVLELVNDKVHIKNIDSCTKCGLCEMRCPDYAIYLEKVEG